jgi:Holliday junction resolvasome RuvABC endonuclease subunit
MTIDPGTSFLGWAVSKTSPDNIPFFAALLDHGTIYGEGKGTPLIVDIVSKVDLVIAKYNPDVLCLEDYMYIRGKTTGIFAVPALLGVLKYHWYLRTSKEAIMILASTWKTPICGNPSANKLDVRESLSHHIPKEVMEDIKREYRKVKGKGEQDCIDAMAINLYVCKTIDMNRRLEKTSLS